MHHIGHIEARHNFYYDLNWKYGCPVRLLTHHFWKSVISDIIGRYIAVFNVASI